MKFPRWAFPFMLRSLSLLGLTSASGTGGELRIGLSLSTPAIIQPNAISSQPRPELPDDFSLDLNFFVQVANHELKIPIMPLHLLGKKSWNVYNTDNIERVKRDELAAKAAEEAEEQRMQEADAERRMQILRGEEPTPLQIENAPGDASHHSRSQEPGREPGRERKRRKKSGEDDTDFEMRMAHDQTAATNIGKQIVLRRTIEAPLIDQAGHIDLFPQEKPSKSVEKNAEAEKEAARKKKEYEDQYTMRFSNAAGFKQGLENPWYSKSTNVEDLVAEPEGGLSGKDVWGNPDPRRKEREARRTVSSDPLAMMRQGAAQARQVEKERRQWREEKETEIRELEKSEKLRKRRKRRHEEDDDDDELEKFSLDQSEGHSIRRHDEDKERKHRHRCEKSRRNSSRDRDEGSRHRHRHKHRHSRD